MYYRVLIISLIEGRLNCSKFWQLLRKLLWTSVYGFCMVVNFQLIWANIKVQIAGLCEKSVLSFETVWLSWKVVAPFCIPTSNEWKFLLLHIPPPSNSFQDSVQASPPSRSLLCFPKVGLRVLDFGSHSKSCVPLLKHSLPFKILFIYLLKNYFGRWCCTGSLLLYSGSF